MNYLSYLHCFSFTIYLGLAAFVYIRNPRSTLNKVCTLLLLSFCVWSFGIMVVRNPLISKDTAKFFESISSFGWISFSAFFLWFTVIFTETKRLSESKSFVILILTLPAFFLYLQWSGLLMAESRLQSFGWVGVWSTSIWPYLFYLYYISFMTIGISLTFIFNRKTKELLKKRQAGALFITTSVSLLVGTLSNVILRRLGVYNVPPLADFLALIWASGLVYVTARYRFLAITPATAAENILSTMSECLLLVDNSGAIITANRATLELLEYGHNDLKGKALDHILSDENFTVKVLPSILQGKEIRNYDLVCKANSGKNIPVSFSNSILWDEEQNMAGIVCVANDITERKQAEAALRKARDELEVRVIERTSELAKTNVELEAEIVERENLERALVEESQRLVVTLRSIADGVIATDTRGKIVLMNEASEELTGWSLDEARGRYLPVVFNILDEQTREPCESPAEKALIMASPVRPSDHALLLSRDGQERIVANSAAPIRGLGDRIVGAVLVFHDVTDKRKMEAELLKSMKLESLSVLAGGIAHDFNNLLTVILTNLSVTKQFMDSDDDLFQALMDAESASLQAKDLTRQLLTFSKGGAPIKQVASLTDLLVDTAEFALSGTNVGVEFCLPSNLWPAEVDTAQISQVIQNLVINAIQAMPEGGTIHIGAENVDNDKERHPTLPAGRYISICIQDEGLGIKPQDMPNIFDPYFTTKQKGSGLGLATAYSVIKRHKGRILANSQIGKGTTFHIYLPATEKPLADSDGFIESDPMIGHGKVLVMDDKELILGSVRQALTRSGYEVEVAKTGEEAVQKYSSAIEHGRSFDVVMLDLTVPAG